MSCQLCQPAYASGKHNGERDGRLAVARELAAFGGAIISEAERRAAAGDITSARQLVAVSGAISDFAKDLVARVQKEFG